MEADRSRADDYYLAEGTGLADLLHGEAFAGNAQARAGGTLDGDAYEAWVGGYTTDGAPKGRLRTDGNGLRFVEVVVNGPKSWSLAAAVRPEIAAAYDAAQESAAHEIVGWLTQHSTTRVGPRGRQVQVPVERLEAAVVRHHASRAGDPHRHLHLQVSSRVWAAGAWRGLHSVGVVDSIEAINGIGHAAVATDPQFRRALAEHGYTLDPNTAEIVELQPYVGAFSARAAQITRHTDTFEAAWRAEHPGQESGPGLRRAWDRRAWATARPDKVVPVDGTQLTRRWLEELTDAGFTPPTRDTHLSASGPAPVGHAGFVTLAGEQVSVGDRVTTRRNDRDLGVTNRDRWTITTTVHGAQGETVDTAHFLLDDTTGAASAYVAMTRGRHHNTAHLVADNETDARARGVTTFTRDRADLGPAHAAAHAADEIDRYGPLGVMPRDRSTAATPAWGPQWAVSAPRSRGGPDR